MRARISVGERYGRLTVVSILPRDGHYKRVEARCDCGKTTQPRAASLRTGNTKSCGCLAVELASASKKEKPTRRAPEYETWSAMIQRCTNSKHSAYARYGGRGIRVCDEWVGPGGFARFFEHIGPRPTLTHSIDRINNDGNYEPGNVRWATIVEQSRNKGTNVNVEFDGATKCLTEWSEVLGRSVNTIQRLAEQGRPLDESAEPVHFPRLLTALRATTGARAADLAAAVYGEATPETEHKTRALLSKLKRKGLARPVERGLWVAA